MIERILRIAAFLILAVALLLGALALLKPTARQIEAAGRAEIDRAAAASMRSDTAMSWVLVAVLAVSTTVMTLLSIAMFGVVVWMIWERRDRVEQLEAPPVNWEG